MHNLMQGHEDLFTLYNIAVALLTVPFPEEGQQKPAGKMVQIKKKKHQMNIYDLGNLLKC